MNWKPAGKLVVEDGAVRFMDNFLWATVYEEVRYICRLMSLNEPANAGMLVARDERTR